LIKLHKRTLDELRRSMVALENQKSQLQLLSKTLSEELLAEMKLAADQPEMGHFFGDFAKRIQQRQSEIAKEITGIERQMTQLGDQISEAFTELKKIEIALENAKLRAKEKEQRKEAIAMDEIAIQQHRRREENGG
jgi:flagellar FliJ protein